MRECFVNVFDFGQKWPLEARARYGSRREDQAALIDGADMWSGLYRPLYRIHVKLKEWRA